MSPPGYGIGPFAVQAAPDAAQGSETNPPFERVEKLTLSPGEDQLSSMVIDPAGEFAYLGTTAGVVKVDLATFERVDVLPASSARAGIIGPTGEYAYFDPDGRYAYFGAFPGPSFHPFLGLQGTPARVIKVDLETFERVGAIVLADGVRSFKAATVDPAGEFAYFGDVIADPGLVVKVRIGAADTDLPGALTPLQPSRRLLDTRQPGGTTIDGQFQADGTRPADATLKLSPAGTRW